MLARRGKDVVVLEAGGYYNEADFNQLELWAYENLYRAGGLAATAERVDRADDGLQPRRRFDRQLDQLPAPLPTGCARSGSATTGSRGSRAPDFDRILDAASERVNVNDRCSDYNGPDADAPARVRPARLRLAARSRATPTRALRRRPRRPDGLRRPVTGAKLGTLKTWLQDAADAGARFVVDCSAERVLVEDGRAAGVEGTYRGEDGRRATRRRPRAAVVVAAGALDTPALLLRSGIGGPAAGDYLRLHPGDRRRRHLRRAAEGLVGPAAGRPQRRVRRRRGRLRVPDRDLARLARA